MTLGTGRTPSPAVALAASTGGPHALAAVLRALGALPAPVFVVQHIHADFLPSFVEWIGHICPLPVRLATDGSMYEPGHVYVAPPGRHLTVSGSRLGLTDLPATIHRPSADELFSSLAQEFGASAVGALLTGMGDDGAAGLLALHRAGATTIAQDERTSAVFGMPRAARLLGAASLVLPLDEIADAIHTAVEGVRQRWPTRR